VGSREDMADAVTRSHLADGRVVGWYGEPGVVIDAEIASVEPPETLARRYGHDRFWARWTAAECRAKLADVPIAIWLRTHGIDEGPGTIETVQEAVCGVVVSVGRCFEPG
jgi:hypothetical protein